MSIQIIDWQRNIDKGFIWNTSNSEFACDKSFDVGEYSDYANDKCRKRPFDKLAKKCSENIGEKNFIQMK